MITWTRESFQLLEQFVLSYSGIVMGRVSQKSVRDRVAQHIESQGLSSVEDYILLLQTPSSAAIRGDLISLITVSESFFFRNPDQFRYLAKHLLPALAENRRELGLKEIKVLSAGCATGEEVYSLAAISLWFRHIHPSPPISIIGVDINPKNIGHARQGLFQGRSIRKCSNQILHEFGMPIFRKLPNGFEVIENIRNFVKFKTLNLKEPESLKTHAGSDIIMCRNVLIYFEESLRNDLMKIFLALLNPDGMLFLGETESILSIPHGFELVPCLGAYGYRKARNPGKTT